MTDTKHWILKIVPALAFAAGIIMMAIGGIMTISSSAKLVLFDSEPYNYITRDQCEFDYHSAKEFVENKENSEITKKTESEIERCLAEKRLAEKKRYQDQRKQNIVDGVSSLIVGLVLVLSFRRRK